MNNLEEAIKVIKQGGIIIYPTDTAFGIGCRIDDQKAVDRLLRIRKRPAEQASPVLFDKMERVSEFVAPFSPRVKHLMNTNWPGALTIVIPCKVQKVPSPVRGGGKNLGVRIPDHPIPVRLVKGADIPILGPSANFHGGETPYIFKALDKRLIKLVDFVLEGETRGGGLTSTVVDCSSEPWKLIRQGAVMLDL